MDIRHQIRDFSLYLWADARIQRERILYDWLIEGNVRIQHGRNIYDWLLEDILVGKRLILARTQLPWLANGGSTHGETLEFSTDATFMIGQWRI